MFHSRNLTTVHLSNDHLVFDDLRNLLLQLASGPHFLLLGDKSYTFNDTYNLSLLHQSKFTGRGEELPPRENLRVPIEGRPCTL